MSFPSADSACCRAGPAWARSITAPFTGNLIVRVTCSGSRTTRCARPGSNLTNALIKLSSLNSWAAAGTTAARTRHAANAAGTREASGVGVARRPVIEESSPLADYNCREHRVDAPGSLERSASRPSSYVLRCVLVIVAAATASTGGVPRVVVLEGYVRVARGAERRGVRVVQVRHRHELLDAPAVDGLAREQVPLGVERDGVQEREVAGHVARHAEPREDVVRPGAALDGAAGPAV